MKTTINLHDELIAANRRVLAKDKSVIDHQTALDRETDKLITRALDRATNDVEAEKKAVLTTLGMSYKVREAEAVKAKQSKWAHLPQERIFNRDAIRAVCLRYNLRFLSTEHYTGSLDAELPEKVAELRALNGGVLPGEPAPKTKRDDWPYPDLDMMIKHPQLHAQYLQATAQYMHASMMLDAFGGTPRAKFCIAAPATSFELQDRPIDPLLFCELGDGQFYLVHKWGNDLSVWRRMHKHATVGYRLITSVAAVSLVVWGVYQVLDGTGLGAATMAGSWILGSAIFCAAFNFHPFKHRLSTDSTWDSPFKS